MSGQLLRNVLLMQSGTWYPSHLDGEPAVIERANLFQLLLTGHDAAPLAVLFDHDGPEIGVVRRLYFESPRNLYADLQLIPWAIESIRRGTLDSVSIETRDAFDSQYRLTGVALTAGGAAACVPCRGTLARAYAETFRANAA